ncbi:hypothetical protein ACHWQZ_G006790 [Mnemiopsis leidyi]
MVKPYNSVQNYVVISTLLGCLSAFQLYTLVPENAGDFKQVLDETSNVTVWEFLAESNIDISVYGSNLSLDMTVFVAETESCLNRDMLSVDSVADSKDSIRVSGLLPAHQQDLSFICFIKDEDSGKVGKEVKSLPFVMKKLGLDIPKWARIICSLFLLCLSGLFSGLNLGLMSLDLTSLRILKETGSPQEKRYARSIEPVRKQGNFLLCTLLLGNVLVNNTLTILLDGLFGGVLAIIGATAGIVVMGEIIPQAICQRFGLIVGARTLFITKIFMVLTCPLSWPISKLLDLVLGEELGIFYRREQLKELLMLTEGHHDIHREEVLMITGVLSINEKTVRDIMTEIDSVYMLNIDINLDFEVMQEIMSKGFSRIPVYEGDPRNIVGLLFVKDLAFVDPDDKLPLESVIKFYNHTAHKVLGDMKVLKLMQDFMTERYHMAIVADVQEKSPSEQCEEISDLKEYKKQKIGPVRYLERKLSKAFMSAAPEPDQEDLDPVYVPIGVVTLEDIIEEIIQQEIVDETDAYVNNDFKKKNEKKCLPLIPIDKKKDEHVMKISPQLELATFTYLSTQIPEFSEENISASVLHRLLRQDVIREVEPDGKPIIESGKTVDFMAMILTGELKIEVGREKMIFEQGPFSTFCIPALSGPYIPDITVVPSDVTCQYLCIHRDAYRRAIETCEFVLQEKAPPLTRHDEKDQGARSPNGLSRDHCGTPPRRTGSNGSGSVDLANSKYHVCCNASAV